MLKNKKFDEAIAKSNAALLLDPNSKDAIALKNEAKQAKQDAEDTAARLAREKIERQVAALLAKAKKALEEGRYADARQLAREALQLDPDSSEALTIQGDSVYLADPDNKNNRDTAKKIYEAALRQNPQDWNAHFRLGQIAFAEGDIDTAIDHLEKASLLNLSNEEIAYELGKGSVQGQAICESCQVL